MKAQAINGATPTFASDLLAMTKPRITLMVVLTTAVGFVVSSTGPLAWILFVHTLLGTAWVASGASVLNQVLERHTDALMRRTADRPLPAGRISPDLALAFGVALAIAGLLQLVWLVNLSTALLGAISLVGYVFVYTPMKRKSSLATVVGAVPGAIPPMMGCAAAAGFVDNAAWALFGILFFWQMPHFLAIAWLCREDYQRGGFPMLTVGDTLGLRTGRQTAFYAAALVPVSLLPAVFGFAGLAYAVGAVILALVYLAYSLVFSLSQNERTAKQLLLASVLYLPAALLLLVVERMLG